MQLVVAAAVRHCHVSALMQGAAIALPPTDDCSSTLDLASLGGLPTPAEAVAWFKACVGSDSCDSLVPRV